MKNIITLSLCLILAGCHKDKGSFQATASNSKQAPVIAADTPITNDKAPNTNENRSWGTYHSACITLLVLAVSVLGYVCYKQKQKINSYDVTVKEINKVIKPNAKVYQRKNVPAETPICKNCEARKLNAQETICILKDENTKLNHLCVYYKQRLEGYHDPLPVFNKNAPIPAEQNKKLQDAYETISEYEDILNDPAHLQEILDLYETLDS
ncbi:hypothetical protein [Candidatus Endomicrobiellum agilis]|uniref:hypothetical protein n=1 Tax=Candidatus Endomicrobiellum agilis TaxID=3238957 RepID=UPI00357BF84C|nr:hypothetical protein [Endomicrobium sp.]